MNFLFQHTAFDPVTIDPAITGKIIDTKGLFWWVAISVCLMILFGIIFSAIVDKDTTISNVIAFICFILVLLSFVSLIVAGIALFNTSNANRANDPKYSSPKYNIEETQKWAKDTYLIELTKKQAENLIMNRVNDGVSNQSVLVKYYNKDVFVQLVQIKKNEWALFMNDQVLPRTDK